MRTVARRALAALLVGGTAGCGTLINTGAMQDPWGCDKGCEGQPYGGVMTDVGYISESAFAPVAAMSAPRPAELTLRNVGDMSVMAAEDAVYFVGGLIDLPLSAVGDTLTLPVAMARSRRDAAPPIHVQPQGPTPEPGLHRDESH
jgi:uncharacterized protein YceK